MQDLNPARKSRRVAKGIRPAFKDSRKTLKALMCLLETHIAARGLGGVSHTRTAIYQEPNGHWSYEINPVAKEGNQ